MATLALAAAGAAVGGSLLPAGVTILGATLTGAAIGSQIGAFAGSFVDQALFGAAGRARRRGPAPERAAHHGVVGRRADPAPLRPRPPRRPGDLGHRLRGGGRHARIGGGGKGGSGGDPASRVPLLRQLRRRPRRGSQTGIGRVWADGRSSTSPPSPTASTPAARRQPPTA